MPPVLLSYVKILLDPLLDVDVPDWLHEARQEWAGPLPRPEIVAAVAIWRDPWMVVGRNTFTGDVVARLGWRNAFAGHSERYPHVDLAALDRDEIDVVILPDEPYVFTADDGPEAFRNTRTALVSGRLLTWYGPSLVGARTVLGAAVT